MREWGPALVRLAIGSVFIAHGAQKLLGVWGGPGLDGTAGFLASLGLPAPFLLAVVLALSEALGGLLLILGAYTAWVAAVLVVDMAVAIWKVHYANGFFINWTLAPGVGHGTEFNVVLMAGLLSLMITGPGIMSIDRARRLAAEEEAAGRARLRAKVNQ